MKALFLGAVATFAALSLAAPAEARRTVIDAIEDPANPGNEISVVMTFEGYCDLNGEECDPELSAFALPYQVSFGGGAFSNRVFVTGNGIVSFGNQVDFSQETYGPEECYEDIGCYRSPIGTLRDRISNYDYPALADYERNLVSLGQSNDTDFFYGEVFFQSARMSISSSGVISANFYSCFSPHGCNQSGDLLRLTPTSSGFLGEIITDFGRNGSFSNLGDQGFVIDGVTTNITGNTFFLPAQIRGLVAPGVPEPSTWAMLIAGFGAIGGAMRSRRKETTPRRFALPDGTRLFHLQI